MAGCEVCTHGLLGAQEEGHGRSLWKWSDFSTLHRKLPLLLLIFLVQVTFASRPKAQGILRAMWFSHTVDVLNILAICLWAVEIIILIKLHKYLSGTAFKSIISKCIYYFLKAIQK